MHQQSLFSFRPNCLVRMSKDDIIDQYDIFPIKIGEGNDAVVYKAKQKTQNGMWRAVKKIHRSYIQKEEYLVTQIDILKKLDHPGILKIFEVFDDSQYVFIVTELCQGNSLLNQLRKRQYFDQQSAKIIFKKIIQIIAYCHQNKIIHRDLKLQNLVYCSKQPTPQSIRLIDFGMSFQWNINSRIQIKNTFSSNKIVGTVYYMAPQIYNETYDHRVDIWSAGVILFLLLTGQLPFYQDEDQNIVEAIKSRKVSYQKIKSKNCSQEVIQLLKRIFESQFKRITIQQILNHTWFKSLDQQQLRLSKQKLHYFSLIPFKQFQIVQQYYQYCQQKIFQLTNNSQNKNKDQISLIIQKDLYKTLNWNNLYEFLKLSLRQKAIKIYLTYRMINDKFNRYIKIFDHFKTNKKQVIQLQTLYEHLNLQYETLLANIGQKQSIKNNKLLSNHNYKRKLSFEEQKTIFSVKKIYKQLLKFLQKNKYSSIGYTMFVSWICDLSQFNQQQIQNLKNKMNQKDTESTYVETLQKQIDKIHKVVRQSYLQKSQKSKYKYRSGYIISLPQNIENDDSQTHIKKRQMPKLTLNIQKDPLTNLQIKKTPRKTIKQNILQSISPTFIRKNPLQSNIKLRGSQTQRPKGSKLQNKDTQSGFLHGINKIISYF